MRRPLSVAAGLGLVAALALLVTTGGPADARPVGSLPAAAILDTTFAPTPGPTTPDISPFPPSEPGDFRVVSVTSQTATFTWTASTPGCCGVDHYELTYGRKFGDLLQKANAGNVTTFTVTGLRTATQYWFKVHAVDVVGHTSAPSDAVEIVTLGTDTGADLTPPSPPTDLTAVGRTAEGLKLKWSPATDEVGVVGYTVYSFTGTVSTALVTVTGTSATVPLDTPAQYFYVRAFDAAGNGSVASNIVKAPETTPVSSCRASYRASGQWAGGFVAELAVTNAGSKPISGWTVTFDFGGDQQIDSSWSASFEQSGKSVTLAPGDWNRTIAAGDTVWLGVLGHWTASNAAPTSIALNGVPCAVS